MGLQDARAVPTKTQKDTKECHPHQMDDVGMHSCWIIDSGASHHMTPTKELFSSYIMFRVKKDIHLPNVTILETLRKGDIISDQII